MTYINRYRGLGDDAGDCGFWDQVSGKCPVAPASSAPPEASSHAVGVTTTSSDFVNRNGVCRPINKPALYAVQEFQSQLNRVAQVKGFPKTAVDGDVGPGTVALFQKVQAVAGAGTIMGDASSCMGVAPDVDVIGEMIRQYADSIGAPAKVSPPLTSLGKTPTIFNPKTNQNVKVAARPGAGGLELFAGLGPLEKLALLGAFGGIAYLTLGKKKRRK
jgi:hypothetical protein